MNNQSGQSLIELLIAMAIFTMAVTGLSFLVIDSYASGRLAQEITAANFLAEEGLEAARSIRDHNWNGLAPGSYGLATSTENTWIFQGSSEDLSSQLKDGATRVITVEDLGSDRKKIVSTVFWKFSEDRPQEVSLVTYLTNWAKSTNTHLTQFHYRWRNDDGRE